MTQCRRLTVPSLRTMSFAPREPIVTMASFISWAMPSARFDDEPIRSPGAALCAPELVLLEQELRLQ